MSAVESALTWDHRDYALYHSSFVAVAKGCHIVPSGIQKLWGKTKPRQHRSSSNDPPCVLVRALHSMPLQ